MQPIEFNQEMAMSEAVAAFPASAFATVARGGGGVPKEDVEKLVPLFELLNDSRARRVDAAEAASKIMDIFRHLPVLTLGFRSFNALLPVKEEQLTWTQPVEFNQEVTMSDQSVGSFFKALLPVKEEQLTWTQLVEFNQEVGMSESDGSSSVSAS